VADELSVEQAQASLDRWCALRGDTRLRPTGDGKASVLTLAAAEPLAPLPAVPFPASLTVTGRHRPKRWSPSAATSTRCHPNSPERR
jgi:hypothetical protein